MRRFPDWAAARTVDQQFTQVSDEARSLRWVRRASFVLNVDDVKLGAVLVALGTSEHSDSDLRVVPRLIGADIGKDIVVLPGDDPPLERSMERMPLPPTALIPATPPGDFMRHIANAHRSQAHPLAWWFPGDGRELLFTAGWEDDGELRCWDAASGRRVLDFEADPGLVVLSGALTLLPDGRLLLATADPDGLHRWDATTGRSLCRADATTILQVATSTSASGRTLFVGAGIDGHLHRWDAATGTSVGPSWECHNGYVHTVTTLTLPDGTPLVVTGGEDGTVCRRHAETGEPVGEPLPVSADGRVFDLASCRLADGTVLLVAHDDEQAIHRWDAATGEPVGPPIPTGDRLPHTAAVVPVDGTPRVIVAYDDDTVRQWNALTGRPLALAHPGFATAAALRPDGTAVLATGSRDGVLRLEQL